MNLRGMRKSILIHRQKNNINKSGNYNKGLTKAIKQQNKCS